MSEHDVLQQVAEAAIAAERAAEDSAKAMRQRDERVRSARRLGVSTRRIANAARITHTQVRRICA